MEVLKVTVCVLLLVTLCQGDTWSINATHPDYPGKCFFRDNVYNPGEFMIPGRCEKLFCSKNGWLSRHNCIKASKPGCYRGERIDSKRPFPQCCLRKYTCRSEDAAKYYLEDF